MYLEHYGLAEAPFRITPHTDFFFSGANRGATLEALCYAITHDEGIVKISGEVGSGKTMLCRVLMERLPENVAIIYLANPSLSRDDILYALADELGIAVPEHSRASTVMRALQEKLVALYAEGKQVVVLVDEAHAMPMETLEEIRLLSNLESNRHKLLQLVLFGQPELNETLARADMRQLRERITHNFSLEPLVREDIEQYLDFRMRAAGYRGPSVFTPAALKLIAQASRGLTRRINILADKALLAAFAAGAHQIGVREARAAIRDSEFSLPRASRPRINAGLLWAAGGAAATLALTGIWRSGISPGTTPEPPRQTMQAAAQPIAPAAPAQPPHSVSAPTAATPAAAEPPPALAKASATPLLDRMLPESRAWIDAAPPQRWFVQLYRTVETVPPEQVERFLEHALKAGLDKSALRVYHVQIGDMSRYGVIYGDYVSRQEAVKVLNNLPAEMRRARPYPRQAIRLRLDNDSGAAK